MKSKRGVVKREHLTNTHLGIFAAKVNNVFGGNGRVADDPKPKGVHPLFCPILVISDRIAITTTKHVAKVKRADAVYGGRGQKSAIARRLGAKSAVATRLRLFMGL
jgi:hypothetical protein